ncbi:hypothetical protein HDV03_004844 [Kappamyces sp. JEL0829]|nr:hypothetical protein HDV03_004844 [Kappamyces sp. JEL0829]
MPLLPLSAFSIQGSVVVSKADEWPGQSLGICHRITWSQDQTCYNTEQNYNITHADFLGWNANLGVTCNQTSPALGQVVCVSAGAFPPVPPQQVNGLCYPYIVQNGDSCATIAANTSFTITVQQIQTYNNQVCSSSWPAANQTICISNGTLPVTAVSDNHTSSPLLVPLTIAGILLVIVAGITFWHCKGRKSAED